MGEAQERILINRFVANPKRQRMLSLLAYPKRRKELVGMLAHFDAIKSDTLHAVPPSADAARIYEMLRKAGAHEECHVVSEDIDIDGKNMLLWEALKAVVRSGMGSLILCEPNHLAFYESEEHNNRYILISTARQ
jgi:hypothetical protein